MSASVPPVVHHTVAAFRQSCDVARRAGQRVALVPTMGSLHRGHLSLVARAQTLADYVAVSIFVNPTQFGPSEDLERYPRPFDEDLRLCKEVGLDAVFAPSVREMYPPGDSARVRVPALATVLCGVSRPHHFEGVATVVTKLFAATGPCTAVFGRKDYQQLKIIERLAKDLLLPVEVVAHPTVREPDGLALSSRNAYLTSDERARAVRIPRLLSDAVRAYDGGERRARTLRSAVEAGMIEAGLRTDYVSLNDPETLAPIDDGATLARRALLAVAVFAGNTRLIDNVVLGEDAAPLAEVCR